MKLNRMVTLMYDTEIQLPEEVVSDDLNAVDSTAFQEQLLQEIKVTNQLLGVNIALCFFIFIFMLISFLYKLIKHNVTDLF